MIEIDRESTLMKLGNFIKQNFSLVKSNCLWKCLTENTTINCRWFTCTLVERREKFYGFNFALFGLLMPLLNFCRSPYGVNNTILHTHVMTTEITSFLASCRTYLFLSLSFTRSAEF